ncbi:MAG: hypothetical protein A2Y66_01710 [Nitrospirae bacterium RBG_13_41_22]|nr:MAG: hypothetical protein A2Y66_01710 [Nitrospirae bacterium RBG_13_41_22]
MGDLYTYNRWRNHIDSGDLLLYRSKNLLGWAIRKFSHGNVNHAGLVINLKEFAGKEDRRWTLEALEHGIELNLLSKRLEEYKGNVWLYPLQDCYNDLRPQIGAWAAEKVGTPYDYGSLFKNIFGRVSVEANRFFCSEYAFMAYRDNGIKMNINKAPTPADMPSLGIFKDPVQLV